MTRANLAEWAYIAGCVSAVGALLFRLLFFFESRAGVRIVETLSLKPSSFLQLSVLLFVFSLASRA